jgi:hypothetical protein
MGQNVIKFSFALSLVLLTSIGFSQEPSAKIEDKQTKQVSKNSSQSSTLLGMSVTGNKESPRSLTIVPWRDPLMDGKTPEILPVWQPNLKLLDPDAYRRDIRLFLKFRKQRLTLKNAN